MMKETTVMASYRTYATKPYEGKPAHKNMNSNFWELFCIDEAMNKMWAGWLAWKEQQKEIDRLTKLVGSLQTNHLEF